MVPLTVKLSRICDTEAAFALRPIDHFFAWKTAQQVTLDTGIGFLMQFIAIRGVRYENHAL